MRFKKGYSGGGAYSEGINGVNGGYGGMNGSNGEDMSGNSGGAGSGFNLEDISLTNFNLRHVSLTSLISYSTHSILYKRERSTLTSYVSKFFLKFD